MLLKCAWLKPWPIHAARNSAPKRKEVVLCD
jgi:hypothetical protein